MANVQPIYQAAQSREALRVVRWARANNPVLYRRIASAALMQRAANGLGDASVESVDAQVEAAAATQPGFMDTLTKIISSLGTYQAQKDCSKYNLELIKAGRPTVPCGDVAGGVNVGISPETRTLLMWGGGLLALLLLVNILQKGR